MRKSLRKKRKALLRKTARDFLEGKHDYGSCYSIANSCSVRAYGIWVEKLTQDFVSTMISEVRYDKSYFIPPGKEYYELRAMLLLMFAEMQ